MEDFLPRCPASGVGRSGVGVAIRRGSLWELHRLRYSLS